MAYYMYIDNEGRWRWQLLAANYRIVAVSSESYINKKDCREAITLVQLSASAPVYER